ncbi:MAG: transposase [bacterium]|nr:transposase [bacterium]
MTSSDDSEDEVEDGQDPFEEGEEGDFDSPFKLKKRDRPKPKFADPKPSRLRMACGSYWRQQRERIATSNGLKGLQRDYGGKYPMKEYEADVETFVDPLKKQEAHFAKVIGDMVKDIPIAGWIVETVKGMAWVLTAQLIGLIGDIKLFPSISHLWSYAGFRPDQRREKGKKSDWHPDLKRAMFNIVTSLLKAGGYYAGVYAHFRAKYQERADKFYEAIAEQLGQHHPIVIKLAAEFDRADEIAAYNAKAKAKAALSGKKPTLKMMKWAMMQSHTLDAAIELGFPRPERRDYYALRDGIKFLTQKLGFTATMRMADGSTAGVLATPAITPAHRHARAMRKVAKIFLSHIFLQWSKFEGRPETRPWIFGPGGHDKAHFIKPPDGRDSMFDPATCIQPLPRTGTEG